MAHWSDSVVQLRSGPIIDCRSPATSRQIRTRLCVVLGTEPTNSWHGVSMGSYRSDWLDSRDQAMRLAQEAFAVQRLARAARDH
jgi:hypothetical protein